MSEYSNFYSSKKKDFISPHVGGTKSKKFSSDLDVDYITQQVDILKSQNQQNMGKKIMKTPFNQNQQQLTQAQHIVNTTSRENNTNNNVPPDAFDPYAYYLESQGLNIQHNKIRYVTQYINIDSSSRNVVPRLTTTSSIQLDNDPFYFDYNTTTYLMWINAPSHNMTPGDRITITGTSTNDVVLRTEYALTDSTTFKSVEFVVGSEYLKINCSPNMFADPILSASEENAYDMSDVYVAISGFEGYPLPTYIGNVPVNALNRSHQIYLQTTPTEINNLTYFYIQLPTKYVGVTSIGSYNITLSFKHVGGIPLNNINAEYPIDINHAFGYQRIHSVKTDSFSILLQKRGIYTKNFGGSNVYVSLISNVDTGYPNSNEYSVNLDSDIYNVISIRPVSSAFPNTARVFRKTSTFQNTKLYWQNNDDGDYIYSIEISPGNYDPTSLKTEIEDKIQSLLKIDTGVSSSATNYTNKNYIQINIDSNTNIVTFNSYKEALLSNPIVKNRPQIEQTQGIASITDTYTLTINHVNHGLSVGDSILFSGMIAHLGIPADNLNGTHIITAVNDVNTYEIAVTHINLSDYRTQTMGGFAVKAFVPNKFRLSFNYPDTMGTELGFRDVGADTSISEFSSVITNQDKYFGEIAIDALGKTKIFTNNAVKLSGNDYILITCREISNMTHYGNKNIDNVFIKINLTGIPGKILYDTYVPATLHFNNPTTLKKLTFSILDPNGDLFDFLGLDHSFVLEIISGTGIVSTSGREH
jgi:hypothetical protein